MSISIKKSILTKEQYRWIRSTLTIPHQDKDNNPLPHIIGYIEDDDTIAVPFTFGHSIHLNQEITVPSLPMEFIGALRPEQEKVCKESISVLNTSNNVMISMPCGFGKCLAIGTKVLGYNGMFIEVQNVCVGDILMGDDNTPRNVLSLGTGHSQMYKVQLEDGSNFTVNDQHILTLLDPFNQVIDISIDEFVKLPNQDMYSSLKHPVIFCSTYTKQVPLSYVYETAMLYAETECICPGEVRIWSKSDRIAFVSLFFIHHLDNVYYSISLIQPTIARIRKSKLKSIRWILNSIGYKMIHMIDLTDDTVLVSINETTLYSFTVQPCDEDIFYGFTLDGNGRFLLWDLIVTHNTITSIKLMTLIGTETLIVVHKKILMEQWASSLRLFCNQDVQVLYPNQKYKACPVTVINSINLRKFHTQFSNVGCVIIDEVHALFTKENIRRLLKVNPRYLIGLTATPYRPDGYDCMFNLFFNMERIIQRKGYREHECVAVLTQYVPPFKLLRNGKRDWGCVLEFQAEHGDRNDMIIDIIKQNVDRVVLVLCKRKVHIQELQNRLAGLNVVCDYLSGTKQTFNDKCRVLVATVQKVGVGFDFPAIDMLIVATDMVEYFVQYLGRCFRKKGTLPIIYDIVDYDNLLKSHFYKRKMVYEEMGGDVKYVSYTGSEFKQESKE